MAFYFKNTNKGIIMTEEEYEITNICRFCEKELLSEKVRDHCHSTGKYLCPSYKNCNINVTQKRSKFIPFVFHTLSNYDCHMFFNKRLI